MYKLDKHLLVISPFALRLSPEIVSINLTHQEKIQNPFG